MSVRVPALLVLGTMLGSPVLAAEKPALLVLPSGAAQDARLLSATAAELGCSVRYRLLLVAGLLPLMREADERAQVRRRATALEEEGRQLLVGLDHERAKVKLEAALQVLEQGFVRYYDPPALAQVHLLLGMWALDRARPDLAQREFEEAHQLDPALIPGPHYSPQVRAAFEQASRGTAARPAPSSEELRKLLRVSGAPAVVVLGVDPAGERTLLRGAVYSSTSVSYVGVESLLVDVTSEDSRGRGALALGTQLRRLAEPLYPAPASLPVVGKEITKPPDPGRRLRPGKPWYRRWYTWAAVGAVVAGVVGVTVPLATRREVVESTVGW